MLIYSAWSRSEAAEFGERGSGQHEAPSQNGNAIDMQPVAKASRRRDLLVGNAAGLRKKGRSGRGAKECGVGRDQTLRSSHRLRRASLLPWPVGRCTGRASQETGG
jgi:hypothetical protein